MHLKLKKILLQTLETSTRQQHQLMVKSSDYDRKNKGIKCEKALTTK